MMFARPMAQACQLVSTFRRAPAGRPGFIRGAKVNRDHLEVIIAVALMIVVRGLQRNGVES
jgi:hypothetical protein